MSETAEWPTFPITITPASKATKSAEVEVKSAQTFSNAPKTVKTYYESNFKVAK